MPFDVPAEVIANSRLSADYNVLALRAPAIAGATKPGQFVMVKSAAGLDPLLRRPFSIFERLSTDPDGVPRGISLLNKRIGLGTSQLYNAEPGTRLAVLGPLGRPFEPVSPPGHAWMVAGGVGLAPFATLAEALAERRTPMTLFYGGRSASDLYYEEYFERLGATLVLTTEDGSRGLAGRVTEPFARRLAETTGQLVTIYACGPTPMMRAVSQLGHAAGHRVFVSLEPVMGCGLGGCYSCVVPVQRGNDSHFVRSCLEGPVFDAASIVWDGLPGGHP
jgi:dihydroorotate dehydrogenase electron transfer subunit